MLTTKQLTSVAMALINAGISGKGLEKILTNIQTELVQDSIIKSVYQAMDRAM